MYDSALKLLEFLKFGPFRPRYGPFSVWSPYRAQIDLDKFRGLRSKWSLRGPNKRGTWSLRGPKKKGEMVSSCYTKGGKWSLRGPQKGGICHFVDPKKGEMVTSWSQRRGKWSFCVTKKGANGHFVVPIQEGYKLRGPTTASRGKEKIIPRTIHECEKPFTGTILKTVNGYHTWYP